MFRKSVFKKPDSLFVTTPFCEVRSETVKDGSKVIRKSLKNISMRDISSECLPLVSLESVISSGTPIRGDVSFAPTDPTIGVGVERVLDSYFDSVNSNNSVNPS